MFGQKNWKRFSSNQMEKQRLLGSTCILEVDLRCCKACPLRVKKKLQKITGVNSITIDVEKGTIAVSGRVDPPTIINAISKLGKRSELSSFQKKPTTTTTASTTNVSKKPQPVKKNIQIYKANNSQKGGINQDCGCHGDDSDSDLDSDDDNEDVDHDHGHRKEHMHAHHNNKGHHHGHAPHRPNGINAPPHPPRYHSHHNNMYSNGYFPPGSLPEYQSMTRPNYVGYGSGHRPYFRPAMFGRPPPLQPGLPAYNGHGYYQLPMLPPPPPPRPPPIHGYHNQQQREPPVGNSVLHLFSDDNTSTEACSIM